MGGAQFENFGGRFAPHFYVLIRLIHDEMIGMPIDIALMDEMENVFGIKCLRNELNILVAQQWLNAVS